MSASGMKVNQIGQLVPDLPYNAIPPSGYEWIGGSCGSMYLGPLPPPGVHKAEYGGYYPPSWPALSGASVDNPIPEFPGKWDYHVVCGHIWMPKCHICEKPLQNSPYVQVNHSQCHRRYCMECAGYVKPEGFQTQEDWIRATVPLPKDTPSNVIADWLLDNSRYEDAGYMRGRI